jgi:hypothetical protein
MNPGTYTPRPMSAADLMIRALQKTGTAMRTPELAKIAGIDVNTVTTLLIPAVKSGIVTCCKVTIAGRGKPVNEYRIGSGIAQRSAGDYNPARRPVVFGRAPTPILPPAPAADPAPVQPAVTHNTGSGPQANDSPPAATAVAARAATPAPTRAPAMGPASVPVPAGDDHLSRVQAMTDGEFADYIGFLIRLRAWYSTPKHTLKDPAPCSSPA